jgi:antirestriction protein ArdC
MPSQNEIRQNITDQIIQALQSNALPPWRKPWSGTENTGHPCNVVSRKKYSGVNPIALNIAATRHELTSKWWATYRQWEAIGGQVKRRPTDVPPGKWGTQIVFCKPVKKSKLGEDGETTEDKFWILRMFTVFNLDQVDGPFDHLRASNVPLQAHEVQQRYEYADAVIEATGADIRYGGNEAFYHRIDDYIQLPNRDQFVAPEYYETVFHELTHWTEHSTRLNWDRANEGYALGELIAELGSCYLAGGLGLPIGENLANHTAYLKHWLSGMHSDSRFIFKAAAQASRAVDFLLSFSRPNQPATEHEEAIAV